LPEFTNLQPSPQEGEGSFRPEGEHQFKGFSYNGDADAEFHMKTN